MEAPQQALIEGLASLKPFADPNVSVFLPPNPACQGSFSLLDEELDLVGPVRLLSYKYAGGRLNNGIGVGRGSRECQASGT
jgi:hypothetical protein